MDLMEWNGMRHPNWHGKYCPADVILNTRTYDEPFEKLILEKYFNEMKAKLHVATVWQYVK
jgi:N-acetylmuramoyl-L-alanine amidase CwlA